MMNKYKIVFSLKSKLALKEAKIYYNSQLPSLGKRLVEEVKTVTNSIELNPYFASIKYDKTRVAFCKKFPFGVHYLINENSNTVYITAIFNQNKEPFWEA